MTIDFYSNYSDKRCMYKDLRRDVTITGEFKISGNVLHPTIELFVPDFNVVDAITNKNYCRIRDFKNRYYFINHFDFTGNHRIIAYCDIDVLMSWRSEINGLNGLVIKAENCPKGWLNYSQDIAIEQDKTNYCVSIGNLGNAHTYFLTVNGGAGN